jgi:RNA recognition motif-containing protein
MPRRSPQTAIGVLHPGAQPLFQPEEESCMKSRLQQPQRRIFIGNLAYKATETELASALEEAGVHVFRVCIVTNQDTGQSRGFAFVDIDRDDARSTEEIIAQINGTPPVILHGRRIRADKANEKPRPQDRKPRPRGGRGKAQSEIAAGPSEFGDDPDFTW